MLGALGEESGRKKRRVESSFVNIYAHEKRQTLFMGRTEL